MVPRQLLWGHGSKTPGIRGLQLAEEMRSEVDVDHLCSDRFQRDDLSGKGPADKTRGSRPPDPAAWISALLQPRDRV